MVYYLRRGKKIRKDKEVHPREKKKLKKKKNWSSQWAIQFSTYLQKTIYQSSY